MAAGILGLYSATEFFQAGCSHHAAVRARKGCKTRQKVSQWQMEGTATDFGRKIQP